MRHPLPPAVCLLLLCLLPAASHAQQPTATLGGVVTDPNGAVVTDALVRASNTATSAARETRTNGEGVYVLTALAPGDYEVRVEARGFVAKVLKGAAALRVGQTVTLDVPLEIDLRENVIVDDMLVPPLVDTMTSKVDQVIDEREIESLPLNGRNFLELALLTPGNAPAPNFDPTKTNTVGVSSAGQLVRAGFRLDVFQQGRVELIEDFAGFDRDGDARFNDSFNSFDLRVARPVRLGERVTVEPLVEVFNLFNVTNVLGVSNVNYSGFSNVLVRDSQDASSPGFLRSSSFGRPVTTAGGVFGSGGPRAFQFAARVTF
ncbi:MAG TPA: carboxypeptidase-like regulatory domain-containing protein [Pyrinomonadaceae bacterium]|nr:carboxypeptidase-like regulatory domain-containing protein [Pyrinomonadaceae bacterium]